MENSKVKVVIYARVSTQSQDYDRQLVELREYAKKNSYQVEKVFSEKISGAKKVAEREALSEMLRYVSENKVDKVLVYEASRLSRRAVDFLQVIESLNEKHISLYIYQNGLETLLNDGSVNPIAQLVLGIIGQFNAMERSLIRSRMESGYNNYRKNGGKVGRKQGYRKSDDEKRQQYKEELRLLKKGLSLREVMVITKTSINTLRMLKKII
jgi:DNA invertase Pin-like site-specific DNA recombinase